MPRQDFGARARDPVKRDPLIVGKYVGTRIFDTYDCSWVATYDLWYNAIVKHTARRDETTEWMATFDNLDDCLNNYAEKKKPVFCLMMEPYNRWLEGFRYWLTDWQLSNRDKDFWAVAKNSPIYLEKFDWPRISNQTKTMTECIAGVKIDAFIPVDQYMDKKFFEVITQFKLNYSLLKPLSTAHQSVTNPAFMNIYRKEVSDYNRWLGENLKLRDHIMHTYLKDDYDLWWKYKMF